MHSALRSPLPSSLKADTNRHEFSFCSPCFPLLPQALKRRRIPFISVCKDPTYGGVSASYAMQGDVRIAISGARIGFAGPAVILNTVYKMNQTQYDADCPQGFQSAEYLQRHGQVDIIINEESTS